jgi:hypothetical protein
MASRLYSQTEVVVFEVPFEWLLEKRLNIGRSSPVEGLFSLASSILTHICQIHEVIV